MDQLCEFQQNLLDRYARKLICDVWLQNLILACCFFSTATRGLKWYLLGTKMATYILRLISYKIAEEFEKDQTLAGKLNVLIKQHSWYILFAVYREQNTEIK